MHSIAEEVCAQSASWMSEQNVSFGGGGGQGGVPGDKIRMHAPIVHLTMCAPHNLFSPTRPLTI